MSHTFDVIIIGGGNAGFGASSVLAEAGKSVAFIEEWDFGGTCPNRGCTPKKVLVAAAHSLHEIHTASAHKIDVGPAKLDWQALIAREKDMIGFIPDAMAGVAEKRGTVFRGSATFTAPNRVRVGDIELEAQDIVIATGSTPRPLPITGAEHLITSNEVLSDDQLPESVVFIGGGVIAMEFSHVYARAGVDVTILEVMPQLLPRLDSGAVDAIANETESLGVTIRTGVSVNRIEPAGEQLTVHFEHDGKAQSLTVDRAINGAGRVANVASLDLDKANVAHTGIGIEVDEYLRSTSNPHVWVAGDALVTSPQLSPLATLEGKIVGHNIVNGAEKTPDYRVIPSAVYTVPALATVGLSQAEAEAKGLNIKVTESDMTSWFSGKSYAENVAYAKILVDEETDQIVGAHMVGHSAEELIHLFAMAMKFNISASALRDFGFAFPTFSSDVKNLF